MISFKSSKRRNIRSENLIQYTILVFIILWFLMPIIVYIFTKIDYIEYYDLFSSMEYKLGYISLALSLLYMLKKNREEKLNVMNIVHNNLEVLIVVFMLFWSFISALNARDREISFTGDPYRLEGFLRYISYLGFFMLGYLIKKEKHIKLSFNIFIGIGTILSIDTVIRAFIDLHKINKLKQYTSVFLNSNHYGYYLTMLIICISTLLLVSKNKKLNRVYFISFIVSSIALIFNNTFGCYLAVFLGLIFVIIAFYICSKNVLKRSVLIFSVFLCVSFVLDFKYGLVRQNFMETGNDIIMIARKDKNADNAGSLRWVLWKKGIKISFYEPIFGQGPDSLGPLYKEQNIHFNERPHNIFIQLAASLGIPFMLMYIGLLTCIYSKNFKIRDKIKDSSLICICVTVAYLISSFFGNSMYYTTPYYVIFLGICSRRRKKEG